MFWLRLRRTVCFLSSCLSEPNMIVDSHTHIWQPPEMSPELLAELKISRGKEGDWYLTPDTHIQGMATADRVIVFGLRAPLTGFLTNNDTVAALLQKQPQKYIAFAAICPTENNALREVDRCVLELGFKGLKMTPIYGGWHPMDPRAIPLYARAEKLGLPILFHQGTTFPRKAPLKYAHPEQLEDIALRFPALKMVIAHLGHPWESETIVLIRKQPNIYSDISGLFYRPWQFYNSLRLAVEYGVTHKLLFGTDFPIATIQETIDGLHHVVAMSQRMSQAGLPPLPENLPDQILHRDTLALLGLPDPAKQNP